MVPLVLFFKVWGVPGTLFGFGGHGPPYELHSLESLSRQRRDSSDASGP
jgi:hypothetical protein